MNKFLINFHRNFKFQLKNNGYNLMINRLIKENVQCSKFLATNIIFRSSLSSSSSSSVKQPEINLEDLEKFNMFQKNNKNQLPTFLILPEIVNDTAETNEFLTIPTSGNIKFDKMNVEKSVRALGKLSMEFEQFLEEYSNSLKREFEDKEISNSKLTEFINEVERNLLPLHYNLILISVFRLLKPKEFDFKIFDRFLMWRLAKSRLRFNNRNIYCFMCEMKARRKASIKNVSDNNERSKTVKQQQQLSEKNSMDESNFLEEQKNQLVERYIREAKQLGLGIKHHRTLAIYKLIEEKLAKEQMMYVANALQADRTFLTNVMSPQFLDCLPDHVIIQLNHNDSEAVFNSFMRYCPDQMMRKDFWLQYRARASPYFGSKLNNFRLIEKIRDNRMKKAQLLEYENFFELSLNLIGHTMARNVDSVRAFINGLASRTEKKFNENLVEVQNFAKDFRPEVKTHATTMATHNSIDQLHLWDLKYFERLYSRELYNINSRDVRAYFPLDQVVKGMFEFSEKLFGIKIVEVQEEKNVWHPSVKHFKIFDNSKNSQAELGSFYFDPFQRQTRVWMPVSRSEVLHIKPVVILAMNFIPATGSLFDQYDKQQLKATGKELLNFFQVIQLFGKFGTVLQQLLNEIQFSEVAGLVNAESDAFTLVSNFMQLWPLNSYSVISKCSAHLNTGEPISQEFFERIRKSHYHFVSFSLKNDLYLMAMDLNLHTTKEHFTVVQRKVWREWMSPFEEIGEDGHLCSWLDIFKGNNQEGLYYSNKWSEVIAADIFDSFRERGLSINDETIQSMGARFRETFLAQTGAIETNELFRRFSGRDPTLNGYLSVNGFE